MLLHTMCYRLFSGARSSHEACRSLFARVSTQDQTTANQERELRQVAERAGWQVVHVYRDHGISGAKGKDKRPGFNALHKAAVVSTPRRRPERRCFKCSVFLPSSSARSFRSASA